MRKSLEVIAISHNPYFSRWFSAIAELNLHYNLFSSHNPYFSRWFSAILLTVNINILINNVTILILVDGFLQFEIRFSSRCILHIRHNPYFSRWFSAILKKTHFVTLSKSVTILILVDGFLQSELEGDNRLPEGASQSLF